ncbi:unnamed protein product [Blepharisma stoltei]|uniref:Uncharacterized protein n=1 Tax=Blepharisma stoltei TaxID=1481888 RepID=A0AAU9K125_9CILI|nr:unnamed protein product [Blepharisma stoltei]
MNFLIFSSFSFLLVYSDRLENSITENLNEIYQEIAGKEEKIYEFVEIVFKEEALYSGRQVILLNNTMSGEISLHYVVYEKEDDSNKTDIILHQTPDFAYRESDIKHITEAIFKEFNTQEIQYSVLTSPKRQTVEIEKDKVFKDISLVNAIIFYKNQTFSINVIIDGANKSSFHWLTLPIDRKEVYTYSTSSPFTLAIMCTLIVTFIAVYFALFAYWRYSNSVPFTKFRLSDLRALITTTQTERSFN